MANPGHVQAAQLTEHRGSRAQELVLPGRRDPRESARERWSFYRSFGKRRLDLSAAVLLVVLLSPLLLLVACLVYLETRDAVIFRQMRIGRDNKPFTMYKFCTMIPDRRSKRSRHGGPERRQRHKTANDPRTTRVGRLLRRTSIDELPQLINVVRGEMSLVGPRPELPEIVRGYAPWQYERHAVQPGLTGWWQINGRSDFPMHEHTEFDVYYVHNLSFLLDAQILMRTLPVLFSRSGAF